MISILLLALSATPGAAESKPVASFTLPDQHRRQRALDGFKDKKAIAIVFIGTECPLANLYVPTLAGLHKEYAGKGVQFLAINANPQDSFVDVAAHALERDIPFPVLKDFEQQAVKVLGARRTPEAILLDSNRVVCYRGRIDDQYGIRHRLDAPKRSDLKEAIDELVAGKPISIATTEVEGCVIGRLPESQVKGDITFTKHVAPILQKRCQECHRPKQVAPFSLLTFADASAWAETIKEVIQQERMPPWYADPHYSKFANERRLSREEKDTILAWIKQGCAKGDAKDLPPKVDFPDGWAIGKPDAVYQMTEEFKVPAKGVLPYKQFMVDPGFKEDMWVQFAEARPGNRAVVHHIIVYALPRGKMPYDSDGRAATLVGWAPGDMPAIYPKGIAKRIEAGSRLVFEVHYTPNGKEQTDRSSVGVIFAKSPPEYEVETNILANLKLRVPPQKADHHETFTYTFKSDALLLSFMPHMHLRGTSAKYVATYPDGRTETLLSVPNWDFNWQSIYRFEKPVPIPKGTKIAWIGRWDNSPDNPANPDPTKEVRWGLQTWDEMQNGWMETLRKRIDKPESKTP